MLVFAWVFVEQAGLPIPSAPLLLAAGALSGTHRMNLVAAIAFAVLGAVASDAMWYELGRLKGRARPAIALPDFAGARLLRPQDAGELSDATARGCCWARNLFRA